MIDKTYGQKGFTLIEVIVSLVLISVLATMAGLGLVQIARGHVFARQNSETVQKVQIAMARIVKELGAVTVISSTPAPTATSVSYTRPGPLTNIIAFSGNTVQINGTTLINSVTAFALEYSDGAGNILSVPVAVPGNIGRIKITITVLGANNQTSTFANYVDLLESYW